MTQCERVLKYIDDFGSITQLEAMTDSKNRYGEPTHFARYSMGGTNGHQMD